MSNKLIRALMSLTLVSMLLLSNTGYAGGPTRICAEGIVDWVDVGLDGFDGNNGVRFQITPTANKYPYSLVDVPKIFRLDVYHNANDQVGKLFFSMILTAKVLGRPIIVGDNYAPYCDDTSYTRWK